MNILSGALAVSHSNFMLKGGDGKTLTIYGSRTITDEGKFSSVGYATEEEAKDAIDSTDFASAMIARHRSELGACQNRLEHAYNTNTNTAENTQAAESRIRDADMAEEMMRYSKENILAQAGVSMMSQANQINRTVLDLLE